MGNYAKSIFFGNLTRDVELKYLQNDNAIANFSLAINRKYKDSNGEKMEESSFFNCVSFGKQAETLAQYAKKGDSLLVETRPKQETWEDKQSGQKRSAVKFIVESFTFSEPKKGGENTPSQPPQQHSAPSPTEDDVPF